MTEQEKVEANHKALTTVEKSALRSKKFVVWLISEVFLATMAVLALKWQSGLGWPLSAFMLGIVFVMGVSTMYYLGKQAALDATVRGFAFLTKNQNEDNSTQ